jgi:hypothetical protein
MQNKLFSRLLSDESNHQRETTRLHHWPKVDKILENFSKSLILKAFRVGQRWTRVGQQLGTPNRNLAFWVDDK